MKLWLPCKSAPSDPVHPCRSIADADMKKGPSPKQGALILSKSRIYAPLSAGRLGFLLPALAYVDAQRGDGGSERIHNHVAEAIEVMFCRHVRPHNFYCRVDRV